MTESSLRERLVRQGASKVPEITGLFWLAKLLSTALGESTSDFLVFSIDPYVAVVAGCLGLVAALAIQLRWPRYHAAVYWLAVVMVAIFGTMVADVAHVVLHVPYALSAAGLAVALGLVFALWSAVEHTLSIHSITTRRRELFYWATVMATFALGTALGDLTAATVGLGYAGSIGLYAAAFAAPPIAWRWIGLNRMVAFWSSYVITRPLGASVADWLGKGSLGGLGLGDGRVAIVLGIAMIVVVALLAMEARPTAERAAHEA